MWALVEKPQGWDLADWVLSRPDKDALPEFRDGVERAAKAVTTIITDGMSKAMNLFSK